MCCDVCLTQNGANEGGERKSFKISSYISGVYIVSDRICGTESRRAVFLLLEEKRNLYWKLFLVFQVSIGSLSCYTPDSTLRRNIPSGFNLDSFSNGPEKCLRLF